MTNYREILRLQSQGLNKTEIAARHPFNWGARDYQ